MNSADIFGLVNDFLADRGIYALVLILFFLGMFGMIVCKNYLKKLMSMNIMQVSIIFFFLCFAQKEGGMIPVLDGITNDPSAYINPLPHALMLTAIVVSLGTTGVALALLMRLKDKYGTVEEDELLGRMSE
ncbi:MAG: cation:proton antiporter subunit C [Firmicutes bacterium]|nr:cation:proton antiporter subunit C [Bacillota bacterium]